MYKRVKSVCSCAPDNAFNTELDAQKKADISGRAEKEKLLPDFMSVYPLVSWSILLLLRRPRLAGE